MNEVKEANHVPSVELVEKPATRIKRVYRRQKVQEIANQSLEPRAFVEVSSQPPKSVRVRRSMREATLPDPKWMAEFAKALVGIL